MCYKEKNIMPLKEKLPNQLFNLAFVTIEEVLGKNGLNSVLNYAKIPQYIDNYPPNTLDLEHPSSDFTRFTSGLIQVMGEKGARSLMLRAGLRGFEIMLRDMPGLFALDGIEVRKGPTDKLFSEYVRIQNTMSEAATFIFGEGLYKISSTEDEWALEISPCYWCTGLKTDAPICHGEIGFEIGLARWIFGKDIKIEETHCMAKGDPMCRFVSYRPKE
jgi:predicted hydrocarbon binding protein